MVFKALALLKKKKKTGVPKPVPKPGTTAGITGAKGGALAGAGTGSTTIVQTGSGKVGTALMIGSQLAPGLVAAGVVGKYGTEIMYFFIALFVMFVMGGLLYIAAKSS